MRSPRSFMPCRLLVVTLRRSGGSFETGAARGFIRLTLAWAGGPGEPDDEQRPRRARAVDRRAHDAAGPARALADRIEIAEAARAQRLALARHAHGPGAARLQTHEQALVAGEARDRAFEARECESQRRAQ